MADAISYGGPTILQSPLVVELILPFLLVFTIVFAVLQKSKVLGDGKKQVDAIVALVIGLLVVSFASATGLIVRLVPFMAVSLVIILVFMMLWGMFWKEGDFEVGSKVKIAAGIVALVAVVIAVLVFTGFWQDIASMFSNGSSLMANVVVIAVVIIAIILVVFGASGSSSKGDK
jgi:hypothetical protein